MMIPPQSVKTTVSTPQPKPATPPSVAGSKVSESDIEWALALEKAVIEKDHDPTTEETERYTGIAQRLQQEHEATHGPAISYGAETPTEIGGTPAPERKPMLKGLFDYPKDLAMGVTEYAAKGQAKNMVELFDDASDIKQNLGDSWDHVKKGEVLKAGADTLRAVGNTASGAVNFFQVGLHSLLGGVSSVVSLPLNLLDKGAEKAGEHFSKPDTGVVGRAVGSVSTFLGGRDSNVGYREALQTATVAGFAAAKQE
jgi:hypothetical protein